MLLQNYIPNSEDKKKNLHFVTATNCFKSKDGKYFVFLIVGKKYNHLKVTRVDNKPIHNCLNMQEIKNIVLGKDTVAVEIYPKQSDFVNGSNTYHLWTWDGIEVPNLKELPRYH